MEWGIDSVEARSTTRPVGNGNERVGDGNGLDAVDRKRSVDKEEEEGTEKEVKVDAPEEPKTAFVRWARTVDVMS